MGPSFKVDLARPRDRTAMNHDPVFKQPARRCDLLPDGSGGGESGHGVVQYRTAGSGPITVGNPPKAYIEAGKAMREDRYLEFSMVDKVYPTPKGPLTVVEGFDMKLKKGSSSP